MAGTLCAFLPITSAGRVRMGSRAGVAATIARPGESSIRVVAQTSPLSDHPAASAAGLGPGGGIDRILLRFEGSVPPSLTALAESDLRTAFNRRGVEVLRRETPASSAAGSVVMTIAIENERLEQIALKIEETSAEPPERQVGQPEAQPVAATTASPPAAAGGAPVVFALARRLNLAAFPVDGRLLALVVAADELLVTAGTEHLRHARQGTGGGSPSSQSDGAGIEAVAPSPQPEPGTAATTERVRDVAPSSSPGGDRPTPGPIPWWKDGLAATFAFDHFGGGQTHLGVDLTWRRRLGELWHTSLAAQGRRGRPAAAGSGTVDSQFLGGRVALGLTLVEAPGRFWLTLDAGVRAGHLQFDGHGTAPDGHATGHVVGTLLAYADAAVALDVPLGRSPLALRLGAGAGLPLLAQDAAAGGAVVTGASGPAFESLAGLVMSF